MVFYCAKTHQKLGFLFGQTSLHFLLPFRTQIVVISNYECTSSPTLFIKMSSRCLWNLVKLTYYGRLFASHLPGISDLCTIEVGVDFFTILLWKLFISPRHVCCASRPDCDYMTRQLWVQSTFAKTPHLLDLPSWFKMEMELDLWCRSRHFGKNSICIQIFWRQQFNVTFGVISTHRP